ncbi:MAG: HypC/HybG/HupF family hydrogenase formation chaperone [Desulfobacterales bacterium]|jgi:hydrogenase expression/formation protein HypC|nr:HypC/HybG/HupF family hydrogenase formation chaperone [Desulfobacteraceae bacterium]MBT4363268.1 HypC/HybG/HupF family hydrogenase formation chaperone [Desulfobacteraceae bacterium]MBT7085241.1 HypC/HybG/HupF family hydrogenase formation chaperone [Desulfobacterales bacterium]MBT7696358.1 HypC/HybG/HupF family hydrogenase formation chaperone [Desulfobacterales bacterium]
MCIAIPSKIIKIDGNSMATIDVEGAKRTASLLLLDDAEVGDYVIVHAGFAINKVNEEEALKTIEILRKTVSMMKTASDEKP